MPHLLVLPDSGRCDFADSSAEPFNVVIAGGGVAALEAALALRDFGGERDIDNRCSPPTRSSSTGR